MTVAKDNGNLQKAQKRLYYETSIAARAAMRA